ncbi:MAG: cupin domain-containing protein [Chloroflexota bacterium]
MTSGEHSSGYLIAPGEGDAVWTLGGRFATLMAGETSGGHAALIEAVVGRAGEPPLHIHHREHEAWFVLEGQLSFQVGDATLVVGAGSFAFAPMGIPHAFTVDVEPTRVLLLAMPGGFERFAQELGVPATTDEPLEPLAVPGPEVLGPVAERYGIEVIGPPLRIARGEEGT